MLRFFRKIRQNLFQEKKIGRYLAYAFGEVALVIIGIMIAVGLNNMNEAKAQDKKIQAILKQIRSELVSTIEDSNGLIQYFQRKDSLIYLVMNRKASEEDFKNPENGGGLRSISVNYRTLTIQDDGFNNLMQKSEILPDKYIPINKELKQLYINNKKSVDDMNGELIDVVNTTIDHQRNNYDWYADFYFLGQELTAEVLDYYLHDVHYRKSIADYSNIAIENLLPNLITVKIDAIKNIRAIDVLLEEDNAYAFEANGNDYTHWNGTYHYQDDTVRFDNNEDGVKWFNEGEWQEVYPLSKTKFHFLSNAFCQFVKNEIGEINGINLHVANYNVTYQKIKEND